MSYAKTAKELGIKYRIGKYGIQFGRPSTPNGIKRGWKLLRITPLDNWYFDDEAVRIIRENGLEL